MKQTITRLFSILAITSLLLMFSCTEDLYNEENQTNQHLIIKHFTYENIKTNKKLVEKLSKMKNEKITKDVNGKIVYSSEYDFYVDTDFANYIEDENGKHSYIFRVYRDSVQNKVDNIVFDSQEDNTYRATLISYDLTPLQQQNLENGIPINISENQKVLYAIDDENLSSDIFGKGILAPCYVIITTSCSYGNHIGGYLDNGSQCYGYQQTTTTLSCPADPGSSGGGGNYNTVDPNNNPQPHGGGHSNNNTIYTSPVLTPFKPKEQIERERCFINNSDFTLQERSFINTNSTIKEQILAYLERHVTNIDDECYNQENVNFAKEAIISLKAGGEVDYNNEIILDSTFINSPKIKCVYDKLINDTSNNIFKDMLKLFSNSSNKTIKFSVGTIPVGDSAITNGNINIPNDYNIILGSHMENLSNLHVTTTLCHELIHAYMYDFLEDWGYINFSVDGSAILDIDPCDPAILYSNINLNNLTVQERFMALICGMDQNSTLNYQWSHDLFSTWVFNISDYRTKLENLILNKHDWVGENAVFKNEAIAVFGTTNWKQEIAKRMSWLGLENTDNYNNYINTYSSNIPKLLYLQQILSKLNNAKSNCP